jgi:hypothetical protein
VRDRVTGQLTVRRVTNGSMKKGRGSRTSRHVHHVRWFDSRIGPGRGGFPWAFSFSDRYAATGSPYTRKTIEREGARRPAAALGAHTSVTARGHATLIASSLRCTLLDVRIDARPRGKGPACSNVRSAIKDVDDAGKLEHVEYEHCDGERTCNHGHREPSRAIKSHQEPSRAIKSHQEPSRAIKSNPEQSRAIQSNQEP